MRLLIAIGALTVVLAAAGSAQAGGWATVSVDPLPAGMDAGDTWRTEISVLQHAQTPLEGLSPTITIRESGSGLERVFTATTTARPGVYAAEVVFPARGAWNVLVETSWWGEGSLTFGPVPIGAAPTGGVGGGDELPVLPLVVFAFALVLLVAGALGARRLWRPTPASR